MQAIDNHWLNHDKAWEREMSEPEEIEVIIPKWNTVEWEKVELMDKDVDERSEYWLVEAEDGGRTWQGTATYVHDELEIVEDIEIKK